jgi:hypothetical protein
LIFRHETKFSYKNRNKLRGYKGKRKKMFPKNKKMEAGTSAPLPKSPLGVGSGLAFRGPKGRILAMAELRFITVGR